MSSVQTAAPEFRSIPIGDLRESKLNPRRHFNPDSLAELTESVRAHGVLTPTLVRPVNGHFEIAAGHRRFRAAKAAGLPELPAVVRAMDDVAFLEVLVTENLQREDVHPLEEADGYRALMKAGYDVQRIADRVGRSTKYVYDRMKLLELTAEVKELFYDARITAGHAVLLARLSPKDQKRAQQGGLFTHQGGLLDVMEGEKANPLDKLKAVSVRELQEWIDENVRFDRSAVDPMLFPDTAVELAGAQQEAEKIVPITHDHYVRPEAKVAGERTFGPMSWRAATGELDDQSTWGKTKKSKTCDHSVLGVFVVGRQRGETKAVCVDRACAIHWPQKKKTKARSQSSGNAGLYQAQEQKRRDAYRKEELERGRWEKAAPAIAAAFSAAVSEAKGLGEIARIVLDHCTADGYAAPKKKIEEIAPAADKSADSVLRRAAFFLLAGVVFDSYSAPHELPKLGKAFGVDVKKILEAEAPAEKPVEVQASAKAKKRSKK